MNVAVRLAAPHEAGSVRAILMEAAAFAATRGMPMWRIGELDQHRIATEVEQGLFFLAWCNGEAAGTVKFQLDDPEFWPDRPDERAAYIHRLGIRRRFAGGLVSRALLDWAVAHARELNRQLLRLDCDAERASLRTIYERFGFVYHSDRQVGPYLVARYEYSLKVGAA
jgi:GNAT superfamily N-acetyltransferase